MAAIRRGENARAEVMAGGRRGVVAKLPDVGQKHHERRRRSHYAALLALRRCGAARPAGTKATANPMLRARFTTVEMVGFGEAVVNKRRMTSGLVPVRRQLATFATNNACPR